jgi:lipid-A-disaccharide synthase
MAVAHGVCRPVKAFVFFLRLIRQTQKTIQATRPDVLITIDAPEFCLRVSKGIKGIPRVHCVAPTVWAWRPWRAKHMARYTDHLLALFPFEPPLFKTLPCHFIGHPISQSSPGQAEVFFKKYPQYQGHPILCLLPGSRVGEITRFLPTFWGTFLDLQKKIPDLKAVVVTIPAMRPLVESLVKDVLIVDEDDQKNHVFSAASVALAASGTITLELAFHNTPMVVAYKVPAITAFLMRFFIQVRCVALINIVAGDRFVVPECLQEDFYVPRLSQEVYSLLTNQKKRSLQKEEITCNIIKLKTDLPFYKITSNIIDSITKEKPVNS